MPKEQETLSELHRQINVQSRTLQGRLSDVGLIQYTLRAERIKQLFEAVRHESSQPALATTKTIVLLVLFCFFCTGCNVNSIENALGLGGGKKTVTVVVAPKTQSVVVATTQQFTVTVTGSSNMAVAWSVSGTNCSTQDCGSISAAGLYTAPPTIPNPALVAVTATANANSADFGAAAVTIIAAPAPASAMLRGTYTFLLSGSDAEGPLSIGGAFEADSSSQLLNGEIRLCRSESHCSDQAFAGATATTDANNGTFAADILPASTFTFSPAPNNIFKLDLTGSHKLRASGILRPNATPADN